MMRRFTLVLAFLTAMTLFPAPPASAYSQQCLTIHNGNNTKAVRVCVSISTMNPLYYENQKTWIRVEYQAVPGESPPFGVSTDVIYWSRRNGGSVECSGRAPGCNGAGNVDNFLVIDFNRADAPYATGTEHFTETETYCLVHGQLTQGKVWWTYDAWLHSNTDYAFSFNTNGNVVLAGCIA